MANARLRPLSPHLTIWRWGPHMAVSILHRATGVALSLAGLAILTWGLFAVGSADGYAQFEAFINWTALPVPWVKLILVGITWSFFQHLLSGIRHLVVVTGAAF